jgi:hypothetical protein
MNLKQKKNTVKELETNMGYVTYHDRTKDLLDNQGSDIMF